MKHDAVLISENAAFGRKENNHVCCDHWCWALKFFAPHHTALANVERRRSTPQLQIHSSCVTALKFAAKHKYYIIILNILYIKCEWRIIPNRCCIISMQRRRSAIILCVRALTSKTLSEKVHLFYLVQRELIINH